MQKHTASAISTLVPGNEFMFPPTDFCLGISILQKKNRCRNRRHSMQKKMLSNLIQLFIFGEFKSYQRCGSVHTTKANPVNIYSKKGVESFPLKIESTNNFIKYVELRNCFITVSSQPICMV